MLNSKEVSIDLLKLPKRDNRHCNLTMAADFVTKRQRRRAIKIDRWAPHAPSIQQKHTMLQGLQGKIVSKSIHIIQ